VFGEERRERKKNQEKSTKTRKPERGRSKMQKERTIDARQN
jgi:hypothetical protein